MADLHTETLEILAKWPQFKCNKTKWVIDGVLQKCVHKENCECQHTGGYDPMAYEMVHHIIDMATNYHCDVDAHRYNMRCRHCETKKLVTKLKAGPK